MNRFAFIIHPVQAGDLARKFPITRYLPTSWQEAIFRHVPPMKASHITGIRSLTGAEAEGWFIGCPLSSRQLLELPVDFVLRRIIQAGRLAEKLGADIVGLGAFTAVVGDAGITVAKNLNIPVTTGNSLTVASALEGVKQAASSMEIDLDEANILILGATGSIGAACARILGREFPRLTLVARNTRRLEELREQIEASNPQAQVAISTDSRKSLPGADVILTVTSALDAVIEPEDLRPGSVVCDVARPRDVSKRVAAMRDDVLVFEGGVMSVPGDVEFNLDFGFPPGTAYACMSETMVLALEGRLESYSLGRELTVEQILEVDRLAKKHGFRLAGLRSFERMLTGEQILQIRDKARKRLKKAPAWV
ncbi:MAG: shikimate dehydrogenase [Firmicutes bacterium]|jgi:fatty aldehyde-generating acyl-ACP reductase|nr:shikimate dehydrogenase [Bacillota bacterium]